MLAFLVSGGGFVHSEVPLLRGRSSQRPRWRCANLRVAHGALARPLLFMTAPDDAPAAGSEQGTSEPEAIQAGGAEAAASETTVSTTSKPRRAPRTAARRSAPEATDAPSSETESRTRQETQRTEAGDEEPADNAEGGDATPRRGSRGVRGGRRGQRLPKLPLSEVQVGSLLKGRVRSILPYGAFVDIGTITDGLLHVSQMSLEYVRDINELMKVGDEINVRVIGVDMEKKEFSLSLLPEGAEQERQEMAMAARERRRAQTNEESPSQGVSIARRNESRRQQMLKEAASLLSDDGSGANAPEPTTSTSGAGAATSEDAVPGAKRDAAQKRDALKQWYESTPAAKDSKLFVTGKVVSIEDYGAFVSVGAPTDGLVHISEIAKEHVTKVTDRLNLGDEVQVRIIGVDLRRGRISLSMKPYEDRPAKSANTGEKRTFHQPAFKTTMELAFERVRDQLVAAGLMK